MILTQFNDDFTVILVYDLIVVDSLSINVEDLIVIDGLRWM